MATARGVLRLELEATLVTAEQWGKMRKRIRKHVRRWLSRVEEMLVETLDAEELDDGPGDLSIRTFLATGPRAELMSFGLYEPGRSVLEEAAYNQSAN